MKRTLGAILFAIIIGAAGIDAAYADGIAGLHIHKLTVDRKTNEGRAIITWSGVWPLESYENRWLPYHIVTGNSDISFQWWVKLWRGTCSEPPCTMYVEFVTRNVNAVTK